MENDCSSAIHEMGLVTTIGTATPSKSFDTDSVLSSTKYVFRLKSSEHIFERQRHLCSLEAINFYSIWTFASTSSHRNYHNNFWWDPERKVLRMRRATDERKILAIRIWDADFIFEPNCWKYIAPGQKKSAHQITTCDVWFSFRYNRLKLNQQKN